MIGLVSMYDAFFKRAIDILLSVFGILFLSPVALLLYVLVKLDSVGPFLFAQVRIGRDRKEFTIYKIRTMDAGSSVRANDKSQTYITTVENDPRITRIGVVLRKFHIDELPQLLNILLGDMSLVGVRPDAPSQSADYKKYDWVNRHLLRPGITGLSQIHTNDERFDFGLRINMTCST